ncbi:NAD(P)H-dependent flavin oxidoreductase [Planktotalea arctica]|uniref:NAD(P)H-dependent flavin oxidoreductase n=1 Tax=Planktotalea arctica TaxID=1481893 RepID=UPI000A1708EC|nr:nitronate monooxygenase [Planktotalea arctica]
MSLTTPLSQKFGLRMPILAGGLMWLADAEYVAACAHAGIMGFVTAASFPDPADLRAEIAKAHRLCGGKPFGVNVSMLPKLVPGEQTADIFKLIAQTGVDVVETSGRNPEEYMAQLKAQGTFVIHKVPSVRFAMKAQSIGVDMVAIVGAECGGHPGLDLIGTMVNNALALERLDIPFVIGGGIGHGAQIAAAIAMGASGVVMGTRLLVAEELNAHHGYKQALVDASERDTVLTMQSVRNTIRTLKNDTTTLVAQMEAENPEIGFEGLRPHVAGVIGRKAYETGDVSKGMLSAGHALGLTDRIEPMADIVTRLEMQADVAALRLRGASDAHS